MFIITQILEKCLISQLEISIVFHVFNIMGGWEKIKVNVGCLSGKKVLKGVLIITCIWVCAENKFANDAGGPGVSELPEHVMRDNWGVFHLIGTLPR